MVFNLPGSANKKSDKAKKIIVTDASDDSSAADVTEREVNDAEVKQQDSDSPIADEEAKTDRDVSQPSAPTRSTVPDSMTTPQTAGMLRDDTRTATPRHASGTPQPRSQSNGYGVGRGTPGTYAQAYGRGNAQPMGRRGSSQQDAVSQQYDAEQLADQYNRLLVEYKSHVKKTEAQLTDLRNSYDSVRLKNELLRKQKTELEESLKREKSARQTAESARQKAESAYQTAESARQSAESAYQAAESARQAAVRELKTGVGAYHDEANRRLEDRQRELLVQLASEEDSQRRQVADSVARIRELDESARTSVRASVTEAERISREIMAEAVNNLEQTYDRLRTDLSDWQNDLFKHQLDGFAIFIQNYYLALGRLKGRMMGDEVSPELSETYKQLEACRTMLELACGDLGVGLVWAEPGEKYNQYTYDLYSDDAVGAQTGDAQLVVSRCVAPGVKQILSAGREKVIRRPMVEVKAV